MSNSNSGCQEAHEKDNVRCNVWWKPSSWFANGCLLAISSRERGGGRKRRRRSRGTERHTETKREKDHLSLFVISPTLMTLSELNYLPNSPSPVITTLGTRVSTYEWGGVQKFSPYHRSLFLGAWSRAPPLDLMWTTMIKLECDVNQINPLWRYISAIASYISYAENNLLLSMQQMLWEIFILFVYVIQLWGK